MVVRFIANKLLFILRCNYCVVFENEHSLQSIVKQKTSPTTIMEIKKLTIIIVSFLCIGIDCQYQGCNNTLEYEISSFSRTYNQFWNGSIVITTPLMVQGHYLDIVFNRPLTRLVVDQFQIDSNYNGEIRLSSRDRNYRSRPITVQRLDFHLDLTDSQSAPLIQEIKYDGVRICPKSNSNGPDTKSGTDNRDSNTFNYDSDRTPSTLTTSSISTSSRRSTVQNSNSRPPLIGDSRGREKPTFLSSDDDSQIAPVTRSDQTRRPSTTLSYNRRDTESSTIRSIYNVRTTTNQYFPGDLNYFVTTERRSPPQTQFETCGTIADKPNPLIIHGEPSQSGQFPWHAAIYISQGIQLKYTCGGNLINKRAIITAAHCVAKKGTSESINPEHLIVYLGKNNLRVWQGHEQDLKVLRILIHPDFNYSRFHSDIAILKLKTDVRYTEYVRPVCVWEFDSELRHIVSKVGQVPGWGFNEHGIVSEELSFVRMPVVTHETCIWSNRDFFSRVTSDKTFCAGFRNSSTVCNGDSGGGMVFKENNRWYLRGIVSVSIALQNHFLCDPEHYAVFTDISKFKEWIDENMN